MEPGQTRSDRNAGLLSQLGFGDSFFNDVLDKAREPLSEFKNLLPSGTPVDSQLAMSYPSYIAGGQSNSPYRNPTRTSPLAVLPNLLGKTNNQPEMFSFGSLSKSLGLSSQSSSPETSVFHSLASLQPRAEPPAAIANPGHVRDETLGNLDSNVLNIAQQYIGTPYVFGAASGDTSAFDCSSYVQYVYKRVGAELPRTAWTQYQATQDVGNSPQPGDLVFFRDTYDAQSGDPSNTLNVSHVAIYMGNGKFIGAQGADVNIGDLNSTYWKPKVVGFRRVPGMSPTQAAGLTAADAASTTNIQHADGNTVGEAVHRAINNLMPGVETVTPEEGRSTIVSLAREYGGDDFAHIINAITHIEGGLENPVGDDGHSFGPFQFYDGGQLPGFASYLNTDIESAKQIATSRPDLVASYAFTYLYPVYEQGVNQGLSGVNLLAYVQKYGQVSVDPSPERLQAAYASPVPS